MTHEFFKILLEDNFKKNRLMHYLTEENVQKFYQLTELMIEKNKVMNVTAITDTEKIISLHYADCLKIAAYLPESAKVIDIGCGGGFPTLPLAIIRPDLNIVGVDSTTKKVEYVAEVSKTLGLSNVHTVSCRAEELIKMPQMRENFDVVISRAVARLHILSELCLPYLKVGGKAVFMKGIAGREELDEAKTGFEKLGGSLESIIDDTIYVTSDITETRTQIIIKKVSNTPMQYPRQFGQIKKKPL